MQTSNPALREEVFTNLYSRNRSETMTLQGVVNKALLLFLCMLMTAIWSWSMAYAHNPWLNAWMIGGSLGGLGIAIALAFMPAQAALLAPIYALCQGLFIGGLSALLEASYPGIVMQGATLTFGTFLAMLLLYKSQIIPLTNSLRVGIFAATGGIALVYFAGMILSLFGLPMGFLYGNGLFSLGFSFFVVGVAALNLILDFDFIEQNSNRGVPKYMEWYGAFALLVTLVWLYIEMVRLLAKMRSRD